ncbi:MAG: DUF6431 domain-containing protein [Fibrobacteria bacterium]
MDASGLGIFGLRGSKTTPAHPRSKIIPCPFCHHPKCNRHGHYDRKATHRFSDIIRILRYRCPPCKATHSILPKNLPPICRWWLHDILDIAEMFAKGISAYAIAHILCETLSSVLHLRTWLIKSGPMVLALTREQGLLDSVPVRPVPTEAGAALALAGRWPTWPAFTHAFSRTLYPMRFPLRRTHTILTG